MNGYPESADRTVPPKGMAATAVAPPRFDTDIIHSDGKLGNKRYICYCI